MGASISERKRKPKRNGGSPGLSPEVAPVARELASIALVQMQQGGQLSIRQREGLRRTFATVAEHLGWDALEAGVADPIDVATRDLLRLAERGARLLDDQLTDELADKKTETSRLGQVLKAIGKLAEDDSFGEPVEVAYRHTAKDGAQGWVTKEATVTLTSASEAQQAARGIENNVDGWDRLREDMVSELKRRRRQLAEMKKTLPSFLQSSRGLLSEVLASLH
jgi:hypothetical protein